MSAAELAIAPLRAHLSFHDGLVRSVRQIEFGRGETWLGQSLERTERFLAQRHQPAAIGGWATKTLSTHDHAAARGVDELLAQAARVATGRAPGPTPWLPPLGSVKLLFERGPQMRQEAFLLSRAHPAVDELVRAARAAFDSASRDGAFRPVTT